MVIGQVAVGDKETEIMAARSLLGLLDLSVRSGSLPAEGRRGIFAPGKEGPPP